jgi:hypothetical protein
MREMLNLMTKTNTLEINNINNFGNILFDQAHNQAWCFDNIDAERINPTHYKDSSYHLAVRHIKSLGFNITANINKFDEIDLSLYDLIIIPHFSDPKYEITNNIGEYKLTDGEILALVSYISNGGSLLILAENESDKYNNNLNTLLKNFSIKLVNDTIIDPVANHNQVVKWIKVDLINALFNYNINELVLYCAGRLEILDTKYVKSIIKSKPTSSYKNAELALLYENIGKVLVIADSDLFGDDSINDYDQLSFLSNIIFNLVKKSKLTNSKKNVKTDLFDNIITLRSSQEEDGSINLNIHNKTTIDNLIDKIIYNYKNEIINFPHDETFIQAVISDIIKWKNEGYIKPNFYNSLLVFQPQNNRVDNLEHLIILPFYTQNGSLDRKFEYLHFKIFWPDWIAYLEQNFYNNPAFIPIGFISHTDGYNTNSAVFFPETISATPTFKYQWGGIFADREAARFILVANEAINLLAINTPPDLAFLLKHPELVKETFILWDLVHDRQHALGELPFDPFMIKQRAPFWMYALEEMRCDLTAYLEMSQLESLGVPHFRFVKYAVILDRIIRFPIVNNRVRNYDGLVGQILFSHLHKEGVLIWKNNTLDINYEKVDLAIKTLMDGVNELYKNAINEPKITFWHNSYNFIKNLVPANIGSRYNNNNNWSISNKEVIDLIDDDEFPLSLFYESLRKKLSETIEKANGIHL